MICAHDQLRTRRGGSLRRRTIRRCRRSARRKLRPEQHGLLVCWVRCPHTTKQSCKEDRAAGCTAAFGCAIARSHTVGESTTRGAARVLARSALALQGQLVFLHLLQITGARSGIYRFNTTSGERDAPSVPVTRKGVV
jgi:hypothetical protein